MSIARCFICLAALALPSAALGDAYSPGELVERLGDGDFRVREAAAVELLTRGAEAKEALRAGLSAGDLEVRLRCRSLLARLAEAELNARLADFLEGVEEAEQSLPGWAQLRGVVEDSREARRLYAAIFRSQRETLEVFRRPAEEWSRLFEARMQETLDRNNQGTTQAADQIAALLLLGAQPETRPSLIAGGSRAYSYLSSSAVKTTIEHGTHSGQLGKLLAAFIEQGGQDAARAGYMVRLAAAYDLRDLALRMTRKFVAEERESNSVLPYALLILGRYGDESDAKLLLPHVENPRLCHTWFRGQDVIRIQIRDVALLAMLHLKGRDPQDFHYTLLMKNPETLYQIYSCGFESDEKRDAAFEKWEKEAAEQKPGE